MYVLPRLVEMGDSLLLQSFLMRLAHGLRFWYAFTAFRCNKASNAP